MTPSKPYLIRAIYDWLVDNELTPYIVVDAHMEGVQVPVQYIDEEGRIVLNISPRACRGLHLENDRIVFSARFAGIVHQIFVPPLAVQAVYAKENGRGMVFDDEHNGDGSATVSSSSSGENNSSEKKKTGRPNLKVIK